MGKFSNVSLKVTALPFTPYVILHERNGKMQLLGLTGSIFDNVSAALNISYDVVVPEDEMWGAILEDGSYTGMLKTVHEKKADLGLGPFTMDESLKTHFWTTSIFGYSELGITSGIKQLSAANNMGILSAFDMATWIMLFVSIVTVAVLSRAMKIFYERSSNPDGNFGWKVLDHLWTYVSALLKQGSRAFISAHGIKFLASAWLLSTLILTTYFTSLIVATLTVKTSSPRIDNIEDLIQRPYVKPLIAKGTQFFALLESSQTESYIKLRDMITHNHGGRDILKLYNPDDISLIMQEKAVLLLDKFSPKLHLSHMCPTLEGQFYIGKGYLYLWNCVWVTHKDFPKDVMVEINKRITWWLESGVPVMHSYELDPPQATCFVGSHKESSYVFGTMRFQDLTTVFFLYLIMSALAIVVFCLEIAIGRFDSR
ncbi:glutamate receptor ionotropic, kainate 5-like [Ixodes scapularis]